MNFYEKEDLYDKLMLTKRELNELTYEHLKLKGRNNVLVE